MPKNKAVVIRRGNLTDIVRNAVAKLLNNERVLVDNRNTETMPDKNIKDVIKRSKERGAPVVIEQGSVGPFLKSLGWNYWMYHQRDERTFAFWEVTGSDGPPRERLITV